MSGGVSVGEVVVDLAGGETGDINALHLIASSLGKNHYTTPHAIFIPW